MMVLESMLVPTHEQIFVMRVRASASLEICAMCYFKHCPDLELDLPHQCQARGEAAMENCNQRGFSGLTLKIKLPVVAETVNPGGRAYSEWANLTEQNRARLGMAPASFRACKQTFAMK